MDGDEMMVMEEVADYDQKEDQARTLYHKIRQRVDESIAAMGYKHFHTISAGGTYFTVSYTHLDVYKRQI